MSEGEGEREREGESTVMTPSGAGTQREREGGREVAGRERESGGWIMFLSEIIKISPPFPVIYQHMHLALLLTLVLNITNA